MAVFARAKGAALRFSGETERLCRFTEQVQLLDASLWPLLEQQFVLRPDSPDRRWRGEFWGKLLRGGALLYEYTGDPALYDTLEASVRRMLKTRDARGVFSTYAPDCELSGWDLWCRKYVLLGMEYFLEICRDEALKQEILTALRGHLDAVLEQVGPGKTNITATSHRWLGVNSCSILEPVIWLYRLTGERRYLDFAAYIVSTGGVSEGGDLLTLALDGVPPCEFPEQKAYETMSFFEGVLEYGREVGDERCLQAAEAFARSIMATDVTVIGCCGCKSEQFDRSAVRQSDPTNLSIMQETCVTVTWMRLCWRLFFHTGDKVFLDQMERSAQNALYGTVNTERRPGFAFDSYSPLTLYRRGRKVGGLLTLGGSERSFGCCTANGAFGVAIAALAAVAQREDGPCLCFYRPGTVTVSTPAGGRLTLEISLSQTAAAQTVTLRMDCPEETFSLYLRIPDWAGSAHAEGAVEENGWLVLKKAWHAGDTVVLTLTTPVQILRQNGMVSLRHGPHVLARDARTGEAVEAPVRLTEPVVPIPAEAPFPAEKCFRIPTADGFITLCDYASCGKTWDDASRTAAWFMEESL